MPKLTKKQRAVLDDVLTMSKMALNAFPTVIDEPLENFFTFRDLKSIQEKLAKFLLEN